MQKNYSKITLEGKEYYLVPVEEEKPTITSYLEAVSSPVEEEKKPVNEKGVKVAVPKLSQYRERYKKHQVLLTDIQAQPKMKVKIEKTDADLDKYNYNGERLFFGEGVQQEF